MKLTDLRVCDNCCGPVGVVFSVVQVRWAVVKSEAVRQAQGGVLAHGLPVVFSEIMGVIHDAEEAVVVAGVGEVGKETEDLVTNIFLCQICMSEPVVLASLIEKLTRARSVSEEVVRSSEAKTVAE